MEKYNAEAAEHLFEAWVSLFYQKERANNGTHEDVSNEIWSNMLWCQDCGLLDDDYDCHNLLSYLEERWDNC